MDIIPGIYQHYKGELYEVMGIALLEKDLTQMVIYKPLYELKDLPKSTQFIRPLSEFSELIEINGSQVQRFEKVNAV